MDRPFLKITGCTRLKDACFLFGSIQLGISSFVCFVLFIALICCRILDLNVGMYMNVCIYKYAQM